jgi:bifunctional non-homologous end joining protein LigD
MALETYRQKRRFGVTPEPRGTRGKRPGDRFIIQKHAARRLHYDLRLELDGVMKSWAVTRGPSLVPGDKRLAVEVEDHPIEYNTFEGTIPEGEYGGGTVLIWDRGHWHPEGDPHRALRKGSLDFVLDGEKLKGRWHLVRMRGRPNERRSNWLLIKGKDEFARAQDEPDVLEEMPNSVATGRSIPEIAEGKGGKRVWHSNRAAAADAKATTRRSKAAPAGRRATTGGSVKSARAVRTPRRTAGAKKTKAKRRKSARGGAPLPSFVPPCLATLADRAPEDSGWIHEIKFDGYRIQARLDHGGVKLLTRKALDWTEKFPTIAGALAGLDVEQALIDGEIVSEGENNIASFSLLQQDLSEGRTDRMAYYAFDLLHLDGRDLTPAPLIERKESLRDLLADVPASGTVRFSEHFAEPGPLLLEHACRMSLEGIISKRAEAPYRSGRGGDWIKTKCADRQEFVVVGYAPSTVDSRAIGALILGYYDDGTLRYAGRSGTGYTHKMARDLWQRLQPLRVDKPPFDKLPPEERGTARNARWVEPRLVVEADFHGWTHGDRIRQASFQGVREDKSPREVVREKKAMEATMRKPAHKKAAAAAARASVVRAKPAAEARAPAYSVKLTHPDRIYWEDAGVTKEGLADYYVGVWEWMAPHLVGRPLALVRCPEGATASCFYQKHASAGVERKWLHLVDEPDGNEVITVDHLDGLITLVQAGVLEIHTRGTDTSSLETCNRLVFDLDPGPGVEWDDIVRAARDVRQRLKDIGLTSFLKTSGGKGLHVVVPTAPVPWDPAKAFARSIAEAMTADDPSRYTATVKKSARHKRIFVDYLRNSREATAVAPYSTRARPGAPVSTPITWEELGSQTSADRYTVLNLHQRLAKLRKDPWAEIGRIRQKLPTGKASRK